MGTPSENMEATARHEEWQQRTLERKGLIQKLEKLLDGGGGFDAGNARAVILRGLKDIGLATEPGFGEKSYEEIKAEVLSAIEILKAYNAPYNVRAEENLRK